MLIVCQVRERIWNSNLGCEGVREEEGEEGGGRREDWERGVRGREEGEGGERREADGVKGSKKEEGKQRTLLMEYSTLSCSMCPDMHSLPVSQIQCQPEGQKVRQTTSATS